MKKLFMFAAAGLWIIPAMTQEKTDRGDQKSFLTVSAGVAVPIMCYASTDVNNPFAGFAKPGFIIDLSYAYRFSNTIGITGSVFYAFNKAGSESVKAVSSPGNYRMLGLVAGPMLSRNFSDRWTGDIKFMVGVTNAHTPKLQNGDAVLLDEHSKAGFTWAGGVGLRYHLPGNAFLQLKADHINLKPHFKMKAGETGKGEQHIVLINIDAGVGLKF